MNWLRISIGLIIRSPQPWINVPGVKIQKASGSWKGRGFSNTFPVFPSSQMFPVVLGSEVSRPCSTNEQVFQTQDHWPPLGIDDSPLKADSRWTPFQPPASPSHAVTLAANTTAPPATDALSCTTGVWKRWGQRAREAGRSLQRHWDGKLWSAQEKPSTCLSDNKKISSVFVLFKSFFRFWHFLTASFQGHLEALPYFLKCLESPFRFVEFCLPWQFLSLSPGCFQRLLLDTEAHAIAEDGGHPPRNPIFTLISQRLVSRSEVAASWHGVRRSS